MTAMDRDLARRESEAWNVRVDPHSGALSLSRASGAGSKPCLWDLRLACYAFPRLETLALSSWTVTLLKTAVPAAPLG